jgi:hypothetical protein
MHTWLTQEQKQVLSELDFAINNWPQGKPPRIHLRTRHFRIWGVICRKKAKFPEANSNVPIAEGKYRGIPIVRLMDGVPMNAKEEAVA